MSLTPKAAGLADIRVLRVRQFVRVELELQARVVDEVHQEAFDGLALQHLSLGLHGFGGRCVVGIARANLAEYFQYYNERRLHQALDYRTPREVYGR